MANFNFKNNHGLTFGTDPEYFAVEMIDGKPFSVPVPHFIERLGVPEIGYEPERKHPVIFKSDEFKVMMDGVAFEANPSPSKSPVEMFGKIQRVFQAIKGIVEPFGYSLCTDPTVWYDFYKWYDESSKALAWCGVFGCDPDRDAIMDDYHSPEIDVTTHPYRYGGGHLHVSDDNRLIKDYPLPMIRLMAMTVGLYSIQSSAKPELEKLRMYKYGQPGRFRVQNYPNGTSGVEYRSPSNLWTTSLDTVEGMFYWTERAYEFLNNPDRAISAMETWLDQSVAAIQTVDQPQAEYILSKL